MKITVVGAILIVATVVAGVLLFLVLSEVKNKQKGIPQQNQPSQDGTGT